MPAASLATHLGLVALASPAKLGDASALPTRIVMLKWGENETAGGPVKVGLKTLAAAAAWAGLGFGDVAIDFNHNTVPGHDSYRGEPAKIAAMSAPTVIEGEGLVFDNIRWTEEGKANAANYPDLSPAVKLDPSGEVIFCHSAALARNGAVKDLHLFSAASITPELAAKLATLNPESMKTPITTMIDTSILKGILKLSADATDEDVNTALKALAAEAAKQPDPLKPASTDITTMTAALTKAIDIVKAELKGEITALNARLDGQVRDTIVAEAVQTGREVPAEWLPDKDGKGGLPNDQLRTLCATLPITVPLDRRTPANVITLNATIETSAEKEVRKQLGISEEQWKKHNA